MGEGMSRGLEKLSDEVLMARVARGSVLAWRVLTDRHYASVVRQARLAGATDAEADDVASAALMKAFAGRGLFDPERPFGPWLASVASNALRDHHRRMKTHDAMILYEHQRDSDSWLHMFERAEHRLSLAEDDPNSDPEEEEFDDPVLARALASLEEKDRLVLRAWVYETDPSSAPKSNAERAALYRARCRLSSAYREQLAAGGPPVAPAEHASATRGVRSI